MMMTFECGVLFSLFVMMMMMMFCGYDDDVFLV
jgi:hypothetical protein